MSTPMLPLAGLADPPDDTQCRPCELGQHGHCGGKSCSCACRRDEPSWSPRARNPLGVRCPVKGCDAVIGQPCTGPQGTHYRRRLAAGVE